MRYEGGRVKAGTGGTRRYSSSKVLSEAVIGSTWFWNCVGIRGTAVSSRHTALIAAQAVMAGD